MTLISCGTISYNLSYIILSPLFNALLYFMANLLTKSQSQLHSLSMTFIIYISQIFAGLGFLYTSLSSYIKSKHSTIKFLPKSNIDLILEFSIVSLPDTSKSNHSLLLITSSYILLTFLSLLQTLLLVYMTFHYGTMADGMTRSNIDFEIMAINIIFISILSNVLLKYSFYYHQIISLGIIVFAICLIVIPNLSYDIHLEIKIPIYLLQTLLSSLRYVGEKWLMINKEITPNQILFYEGSIGMLMTLAFSLVIDYDKKSIVIPLSWKEAFGGWEVINEEIIGCFMKGYWIVICFFGAFITCALYNLCMILVRYYYTPTHCCVSNAVTALMMWVFFTFNGIDSRNNNGWIEIGCISIGHLLLLIGCLIYNEIIICNFWGLQEDTIKEIRVRSENDYNTSMIVDNEEGKSKDITSVDYYFL